ncbi:MAG: B12-binding domain-containing radical SAM protein [Candidatus Sumerlaeaceae bacterium]
MPRALLLVPWIYDFAAYDFWSCPVGLLSLGAVLRSSGWEVEFVDLTDRHHPGLGRELKEKCFHTGKYYAEEVPKPPAIAWVPRRYKRYGLPPDIAEADLAQRPRPDVVLVTSRMTYWYPGVCEAVALVRRIWRDVPVGLGGTYATLCYDHARLKTGATFVFRGEGEQALLEVVEQLTGVRTPAAPLSRISLDVLDSLPFPAWELRRWNKAVVVETSRGCPYHCSYCATKLLLARWRAKSPTRVADEIDFAVNELGAEDIAFADDALLLNPSRHFLAWAKEVERRRIRCRFHTPNSLFASMISREVAEAMRALGFETIRVSLETASDERLEKLGRRIRPRHFVEAMRNLRAVGYRPEQIGVYILCGLPGQHAEEVRHSVDLVVQEGGTPRLAEYSPIPGTAEWQRACQTTQLALAEEPLLQNNSVFWWASGAMRPAEMAELKRYAREAMQRGGANEAGAGQTLTVKATEERSPNGTCN